MAIIKSRIPYVPPTILVILGAFFFVVWAHVATAGTYEESAHGDTNLGVNRDGTECPTGTPCPTGDCTHCHDTFDLSICGVNDIMLFADKEVLCEECHDADGPAEHEYQECVFQVPASPHT